MSFASLEDVQQLIANALAQQQAAHQQSLEQAREEQRQTREEHQKELAAKDALLLTTIAQLSASTVGTPSAAPVPKPVFYNPIAHKDSLVGLLTHLPSAAESEPDVYNIYGEQFWQHLVESKRTLAAEEYRCIYCTLAYQHNS